MQGIRQSINTKIALGIMKQLSNIVNYAVTVPLLSFCLISSIKFDNFLIGMLFLIYIETTRINQYLFKMFVVRLKLTKII